MGALGEMHRRWAREDARHRQVEGALRLAAGAVVLAVGCAWGLLGAAPAVGLGAGLLAMEVARYLRDRHAPEDIAAHIDRVAETGWLMQTALSVEAGTAHGDAEMGAVVLQQAAARAPQLASAAVRPRQAPLPWLGVAGVALLSLFARVPVVADAVGIEAPPALAGGDAEPDSPALASLETQGRRGQNTADDGAGVAGQSADGAQRSVVGGVGAGGGEALAGDGTAQGSADGTNATGGGEAGSADDGARPEDRFEDSVTPETPEAIAGIGAPRIGDRAREDDGAPSGAREDGGQAEEGRDGIIDGSTDAGASESDEGGDSRGEVAVSASATAMEEPQEEPPEGSQEAAKGMRALGHDMQPNISAEDEHKVWNLPTSGAGMGGLNDASATEDSIGGGGRDRYDMVDEWIDSRRRASAEGRVQSTEEGRSGGRSSVAYEEAYSAYAGMAEAAVQAEALPPGRRAMIQRYFEAIRPEQTDDTDEEHSP